MSPRVDVRPDEFYVIAQDVAGDVLAAMTGGLDQLGMTLAGCGSMAGSDPAGLAWAAQYDVAAAQAVRAGQALANGTYHLAELLEQTGVNHERAEAASTTHPGGSVAGGLRAATMRGAWLHDPSYRFTVPTPPPSAAGGSGDLPFGWHLIAHYLHCIWPNGHQDRLHAAAHAWDTGAVGLETAASDMISVWARLAAQDAPEVVDACNTCEAVREHLLDLAGAYRRLARACRELATHIDTAHAAVISELESLAAWSVAIQSVGAAVSFFTLGAAEAPTQAEETARLIKTAETITGLINTFKTEVELLADSLPSVAEIGERVGAALDRLAGIRIEISEVAGVPGLRVITITTRDARAGTGITRAEMTAEDGLARSASAEAGRAAADPDLTAAARGPGGWRDANTLPEHFHDHGEDFGATSEADYAAKADAFLRRGLDEGLPTKVDARGNIRIYDPKTNIFGSYDSTGQARTFYKPTSKTYWNRQPGVSK